LQYANIKFLLCIKLSVYIMHYTSLAVLVPRNKKQCTSFYTQSLLLPPFYQLRGSHYCNVSTRQGQHHRHIILPLELRVLVWLIHFAEVCCTRHFILTHPAYWLLIYYLQPIYLHTCNVILKLNKIPGTGVKQVTVKWHVGH